MVDFAALIEVSGATTLYADADRGGTDTPLDGELRIDDATDISRIRWDGSLFVWNDNDSPNATSLEGYYQAGGDGNAQTIYLVAGTAAAHTTESFDVATYYPGDSDAGGNNIRWGAGTALPAAFTALLDGLSVGDRFIIAAGAVDASAVEGDGVSVDGEGSLGEAEGTAFGAVPGDGAPVEGEGSLGEAEGTTLGAVPGDGAPVEGEGSLGEAEGTTLGAVPGDGAPVEGEGSLGEAEGTTFGAVPGDGAPIEGEGSLGEAEGTTLGAVPGDGASRRRRGIDR